MIDLNILASYGTCYLDGGNPYDASTLQPYLPEAALQEHGGGGEFCGYPPHALPGLALLGAIPQPWLPWFHLISMALALAVVALAADRLMLIHSRETGSPLSWGLRLAIAGLVVGNLYVAHQVWLGQVSVIVFGTLLVAWWLAYTDRPIIAGILLALASTKPQLSLLPMIWLTFTGRWRILASFAVGVLLLSIHPMAMAGPMDVWRDWLHAMGEYAKLGPNRIVHGDMIGLPSLLGAYGMPLPSSSVVSLFGVIPLLGLLAIRRRLSAADTLGLLLLFQLCFAWGRNVDYFLASIALATMAVRSSGRSWMFRTAVLVVLAMWLAPKRAYLAIVDIDVKLYRTAVCLLMIVLHLVLIGTCRKVVPQSNKDR